jgi:hypothetical protein
MFPPISATLCIRILLLELYCGYPTCFIYSLFKKCDLLWIRRPQLHLLADGLFYPLHELDIVLRYKGY